MCIKTHLNLVGIDRHVRLVCIHTHVGCAQLGYAYRLLYILMSIAIHTHLHVYQYHTYTFTCLSTALSIFFNSPLPETNCFFEMMRQDTNGPAAGRQIGLSLGCPFLVPVPARASTHTPHVLAFVVSRFSAGNFLDHDS